MGEVVVMGNWKDCAIDASIARSPADVKMSSKSTMLVDGTGASVVVV